MGLEIHFADPAQSFQCWVGHHWNVDYNIAQAQYCLEPFAALLYNAFHRSYEPSLFIVAVIFAPSAKISLHTPRIDFFNGA